MSEAYPIARVTDPVSHSLGIIGMIGGAVFGAVVGAALIGAGALTGGVAVFAVVGMIGFGGLSGGAVVEGLQTIFDYPGPTTGKLGPTASPVVFAGGLPCERAVLDAAAHCNGLWMVSHWPSGPKRIAEGAMTVLIDGYPAARVSSKLVCGAAIKSGFPSVLVGGPTIRLLAVHDRQETLATIFGGMATIGAFGVAILNPAAIPGLLLFIGANEGLGLIGDAIGPGWRDLLQGLFGFAALGFGLRSANKGGNVKPGEEVPGRPNNRSLTPEEIARQDALGWDPASRKFRLNEKETALRTEQQEGILLERYQPDKGQKGDWINPKTGKIYDDCSPSETRFFDNQWSKGNYQSSLQRHLNHPSIDYVVVDVTGRNLTPAQINSLNSYIRSLPASDQSRIIRIGF